LLGGETEKANSRPSENTQGHVCENCGQPFESRKRGSAQKYCSPKCRLQAHRAESVSSAQSGSTQTLAKTPGTLKRLRKTTTLGKTLKKTLRNSPGIAMTVSSCREQRRTAVYFNTRGEPVIRQEADWNEETDTVVIIAKNNIPDFIDKLTDICGVPSFP
jgi:hypothetical protein